MSSAENSQGSCRLFRSGKTLRGLFGLPRRSRSTWFREAAVFSCDSLWLRVAPSRCKRLAYSYHLPYCFVVIFEFAFEKKILMSRK